jgi:hypothetical protein
MILPQNLLFSNRQNKAEFDNLDGSEVFSRNFLDLRTSAASSAWQPHWPQQPLQPYITKDTNGWIIPGTKMTNNGPLFVDGIIKNPIFHSYLLLFESEAVEVSRYYFFKN